MWQLSFAHMVISARIKLFIHSLALQVLTLISLVQLRGSLVKCARWVTIVLKRLQSLFCVTMASTVRSARQRCLIAQAVATATLIPSSSQLTVLWISTAHEALASLLSATWNTLALQELSIKSFVPTDGTSKKHHTSEFRIAASNVRWVPTPSQQQLAVHLVHQATCATEVQVATGLMISNMTVENSVPKVPTVQKDHFRLSTVHLELSKKI